MQERAQFNQPAVPRKNIEKKKKKYNRNERGSLGHGGRGSYAVIGRLGRFDGLLGQQLNLAHQEALLIGKLVVIGTILKEFGEEFQQAIPVVDQNPLHGH